jgi:DNA ligase (NAD+)
MGKISLRCEMVVFKEDLNRINSTLLPEDQYKNCRNAASGICRRLDGKFCDYIHLIFYDFVEENGIGKSEVEKLQILEVLGFPVVHYKCFEKKDLEFITQEFNDTKHIRESLPFGIDGMVIKLDSYQLQNEMGFSSRRPKGQIAWKFDPPSAATTLNSVTWELGRTGVITPLGHVEPIEIDGSVIEKSTLHSLAEIKRLNIGIGDVVMLIKAGDIIPQITTVLNHKDNPIIIPNKCPSCHQELKNNGVQLFCENGKCPGKFLLRILNFIKVVKIDDFGKALATYLFEQGKLLSIGDIYKLKVEDISTIPGWGFKSANTVINNINNARSMSPSVFLSAIGVPSLSEVTAIDLDENFGVDNILKEPQ